jgi:hypothetical protein
VTGSFELRVKQAVWLFPAGIAVHFLEDAFGFATWTRRHISPRYTYAHWRKVHGLGLVSALAASAVVSLWTRPVPIFLFTALFLTPMVFNSLFHLGTSVFFRRYTPGTTSALVLFPAVCWHVVSTSSHSALLSAGGVLAATVIGAAFHTINLAATTIFLHRKPPR